MPGGALPPGALDSEKGGRLVKLGKLPFEFGNTKGEGTHPWIRCSKKSASKTEVYILPLNM